MNNARLLLICGALFVFGETLLSPFYPQFFARVFGITDWQLTGEYIALCRFTLFVAAPLWGLLARYQDPRRLLMLGQGLAGLCCLGFPLVNSLAQFIALSVVLLACKGSYFLFYSLFVVERGALGAVRRVQQVVHLSIIAATLTSVAVLELDNPLRLFWLGALLDALLVLCCCYLRPTHVDKPQPSPAQKAASWSHASLIAYAMLVLSLALALTATRPYLTGFVQSQGGGAWSMALLYLTPSVVALALLPHLDRLCQLGAARTYSLAILMLSASLILQALATSLTTLLIGRLLFGAGAIAAQTVLELHLFDRHGDAPHAPLGLSSGVQHAGQLLAPLMAAWGVGHWGLSAPFWLTLGVLLLALWAIRPALTTSISSPILRSHP